MQTTITKTFSNLEELFNEIETVTGISGNYTSFAEIRDYIRFNKLEVINLINKKSAKELKKVVCATSSDDKAYIVRKVYQRIQYSFIFQDSIIQEMGESFDDSFNRLFEQQTEEKYNQWINKTKKAQEDLEKSLTNPETLTEFREFIYHRGEQKLTSEQRARLDELKSEQTKVGRDKREERSNQLQAVDLPSVITCTIKESYHAIKNIPLWVVVLSGRVSAELFGELKEKASKLDGYYSKFNKNGAIPGFTFKTHEAAEAFSKLKEGNVDATAVRDAIKQERKENRVESLKEKAERMLEEATESLHRERKDNTHRRAKMAANAENDAFANIQFAKIMIKIAEAIENNTIKHLDKLANITDLNTLLGILYSAKWKHIRAEKLNSDSYEITATTADYARYPYPILDKSICTRLEKMQNIKGKTMVAKRMLKRFSAGAESILIDSEQRQSDYEKLFCQVSKEIGSYEVKHYKEALMKLKRVQRMNIEHPHELRTLLRELISIRASINNTPEETRLQQIRELERSFLHRKIDGFFPTPPELAAELVYLAHIEDGHSICEPNGGLGHLAEVISDAHPENFLQCIEINYSLVEALKIKGFETLHMNFLEHQIKYDRIIMNPPFENLQDIDHVYHAFSLLNPGGRLVAIMANNKTSNNSKTKAFMEFVDEYGRSEKNPDKSFASAFRPTGVSTITVILDKPF